MFFAHSWLLYLVLDLAMQSGVVAFDRPIRPPRPPDNVVVTPTRPTRPGRG